MPKRLGVGLRIWRSRRGTDGGVTVLHCPITVPLASLLNKINVDYGSFVCTVVQWQWRLLVNANLIMETHPHFAEDGPATGYACVHVF